MRWGPSSPELLGAGPINPGLFLPPLKLPDDGPDVARYAPASYLPGYLVHSHPVRLSEGPLATRVCVWHRGRAGAPLSVGYPYPCP